MVSIMATTDEPGGLADITQARNATRRVLYPRRAQALVMATLGALNAWAFGGAERSLSAFLTVTVCAFALLGVFTRVQSRRGATSMMGPRPGADSVVFIVAVAFASWATPLTARGVRHVVPPGSMACYTLVFVAALVWYWGFPGPVRRLFARLRR